MYKKIIREKVKKMTIKFLVMSIQLTTHPNKEDDTKNKDNKTIKIFRLTNG